jgi:hypothetical protein
MPRMIDGLFDDYPLWALPKVPVWQARTRDIGNQVIEYLRATHTDVFAYGNSRSLDNPPTGFSIGARRHVEYIVSADSEGVIDWRESAFCPITNMNARARSAMHLYLSLSLCAGQDAVYMTEQHTGFYEALSSVHPNVVGSEYLPGIARGQTDYRGLRCEDMTALTFADGSFDALISLDVMEHIPDYRAALREAARVVRPGGFAVITAPFTWRPEHIVRAVAEPNGEITHLLPPDYHGDPIGGSEGILCYYWFGWQMLDDLRDAGFRDAFVALISSREFGYLGDPQKLFVAIR